VEHSRFVAAYEAGEIRVEIDPTAAARYLSNRLLLPLFMLPLLGAGVGVALMGWIWSGLALIAGGIVLPRIIKRSAPHFILTQALQERAFYDDAAASGLLRVVPVTATS